MQGFDLIGDVHGCGTTLVALLNKMGYREKQGVYCHPHRKVIFLGDLIDRGPRIRLAVQTARRMVEAGEAFIVMGNHEYNALAYCHPAPEGSGKRWLREHSPRHNRIIQNTLDQYRDHTNEWEDTLAWFKRIPLFLEFEQFRVVHACWDDGLIQSLKQRSSDACMDDKFLVESTDATTQAFRIVDCLTRGTHIPLPEDVAIHSGDGFTRKSFRAHFWCENPAVWGDVVFQPDNLPGDLEARHLTESEHQRLSYYDTQQPPLFIGHYWCEGIPALPTANIACLDYSAVKYGRLVAYRWSGEAHLSADNFTWIRVVQEEQACAPGWSLD